MVSLPLCSGGLSGMARWVPPWSDPGSSPRRALQPLWTWASPFPHCPVLCCLMSSVEKPLFHTSCPFSYLFPMALLFHLGPKVKSFPQFWRPVLSNLVQDPMFCQSVETVSLSLYHLGTWELWGHLYAPDKPQAAWRSDMNSPAHTCYCCAATGQPSLGMCSLFGHPPLAHCSSLPVVPVLWGSGMPIWVTVTATLSLLKVWSHRELRKEPWCWLSQRTQSPAPDWALLPYRLPSSLFCV